MDSILSYNLKCLMIKHNVRQADIVAKTGMCKSHIYEIVMGHNRRPSIWTCVRIAEAIGCSLDDLVRTPK